MVIKFSNKIDERFTGGGFRINSETIFIIITIDKFGIIERKPEFMERLRDLIIKDVEDSFFRIKRFNINKIFIKKGGISEREHNRI